MSQQSMSHEVGREIGRQIRAEFVEPLEKENAELVARLRDAEQKLAAKERLLDDVAAEQNRLVRLILEARGNTP